MGGEFVEKTSCDACGSSDANAIYDDGHSFCFSCEAYVASADEPVAQTTSPLKAKGLLTGAPSALPKRKLSLDTCRKWGYWVGHTNGEAVQIANYYTGKEITGQKIRNAAKDMHARGDVTYKDLYGKWLPVASTKRIVITEGEIDALSVDQAFDNKWPVVSVPCGAKSAFKSLRHNLEWLEQFDEIVLFFDNDGPGRDAVQECAPLFTPGKCKIVSQYDEYKDANEMLQAGKIEFLQKAVWNSETFRPDGVVNASDILHLMLDTTTMEGMPTPYPCLDEMCRGLRRRELVTVCAGSGLGKSTFVGELAYGLVSAGETVGYVALEESNQRTMIRLVSIHLSTPLHLTGINDTNISQVKKAADEIFHNNVYLYDHFGSSDSDLLLSKLRYMVKGLGCDWIILDHLSMIVSGIEEGDERRLIDNTMTKLRSMIEETGAGMILVSHLRDPEGKKGHEEGAHTALRQLRGSRAIGQLSDIVIGLERNQQSSDPNILTLRVLKNRPIGLTGICGKLVYNPDTGRLLPYEGDEFEEVTTEGTEDF